jgi:hypothetical protein
MKINLPMNPTPSLATADVGAGPSGRQHNIFLKSAERYLAAPP